MIPKGREQKPELPAEVSDLPTALPGAILAPEFKENRLLGISLAG